MVSLESNHTFIIKGKTEPLLEKVFFSSKISNYIISKLKSNSSSYSNNSETPKTGCFLLYGKYLDTENEKKRKEREINLKNKNPSQIYGKNKQKFNLKDLENIQKLENGPKKNIQIETIFKPKQLVIEEEEDSFLLLEDENKIEDKIDNLNLNLNLDKVGILIFRKKIYDSELLTNEIITSSEIYLEKLIKKYNSLNFPNMNENEYLKSKYKNEPFVIIRVAENENKNLTFEAFTLNKQCLEMLRKNALENEKEHPTHSLVNSSFIGVVENKRSKIIDNDFFVKPVSIQKYESKFSFKFDKLGGNLNDLKLFVRQEIGVYELNRLKLKINKIDDQLDEEVGKFEREFARVLKDFNVLSFLKTKRQLVGLQEVDLQEIISWVSIYIMEDNGSAKMSSSLKKALIEVFGI